MASYTENYALTKPTMAESADIRVINSNMDTVDDVMHSTQVSLAPAYDMTETYNTGDVVMYELLMYECLEDEVTGAWDATKWQRTTAGEHGGGSDVEVTQIQTEGKAVASIAVDGVSTDILVPELKVYGEASGDLITIEDAMEAPLEECKVTLEPQQDLHGYDAPWVGGAGKNKFNIATISVKKYIGENGNLYSSNNWSVSDFISVDSETAYVLSGITNSGSLAKHTFYDSNKVFISAINSTVMNFTTPSNAKYIRLSLQSETPTNVQLEKGTTATTFAPYSNICPISGWSAVDVTRCGKNLLAKPIDTFTIDASVANCFFVKAGTYNISYTISENHRLGVRMMDKDGNLYTSNNVRPRDTFTYNSSAKAYYAGSDISIGNVSLTINVLMDCYIRLVTNKTSTSFSNAMLEIGSTATSYEPYNGTTYTIQLGDTYYGGKLDVTSGVLTVDKVYYQFDNSKTYTITGSSRLTKRWITSTTNIPNVSNEIKSRSGVISSISPRDAEYTSITVSGFCKNLSSPYPIISLNDSDSGLTASSSATDIANAVNTFLHQHTPQIVYELATPLTIQLTPTQVKSLLGINNLWSDGEMYVKYRRDIEMLLQRIADSLGGN